MHKIFFNTTAQFLGRIIGAACAFFSTLILARFLGSHYFGEYIKITAFIALFYPLVDFGLNTVYLKLYQDKIEAKIASLLAFRLLGATILVVCAVVIAGVLGIFQKIFPLSLLPGIGIASITLVGIAITLTITAVFQNLRRFDIVALTSSLGNAFTLVLLLIINRYFGLMGNSGVLYALGALVAGVLFTAFWNLSLYPITLTKAALDRSAWRKLLLASLPLGLTLLFNIVYFKVDTLILSLYRSSSEVGAYGFAYKFFEFALILPTFIMNSIYPDLVRLKNTLLWSKLKNLLLVLLVVSIGIGIGLWKAAPLLIYVREDFAAAVGLLQILALALPLFYLTSPLMWWYVLINEQKKLAIMYAFTMVLNTGANFIIIPKFGATGAAIVTGLTEVVILTLSGTYLYLYYAKHR